VQKRIARGVLAGAISLWLTGCGYLFGDQGVFRDRSEDYKKAPQTPPVVIPDGMKSVEMSDIYVIPKPGESYLEPGDFEVPRPAPLTASAEQDLVKIQKLGDESWILMEVAPGQLWPQVRNFMSASGMQEARADARAGIIDSNWLTIEGASQPSRFRFRMDQGVQRGSSELHILQMFRHGGSEEWPAKSDDPALEGKVLQAVAQYLADSAETAPVSMLAEQGISAGGKISLQEAPEGYSYLQLELPFDRAWASVARALEKSSFEITDRDRSSGIYYIRFQEGASDEDQSWWSRLWRDKTPSSNRIYLVSVTSVSADAVTIRLRPQEPGVSLDRREEQDMLMKIKGNIS